MFNITIRDSHIPLLGMSLPEFFGAIASCLIIFGGVVPYIPQYLDIMRSRRADGFSLFVCLTLLIANTLRILFWFGHPFELPLLIQSIVMNTAMFAMIHLCVRIEQKPRHRSFVDLTIDDFWKWTDFTSYVQFMALFTLLSSIVTVAFIDSPFYIELLGLLALMSEAMLGVPQFYHNYRNQTTEGMSVKMVLMWSAGDIFKTLYFVLRHTPAQFWLCGSAQVLIDMAIMLQVFYYGASSSPVLHRRSPDSNFDSILATS